MVCLPWPPSHTHAHRRRHCRTRLLLPVGTFSPTHMVAPIPLLVVVALVLLPLISPLASSSVSAQSAPSSPSWGLRVAFDGASGDDAALTIHVDGKPWLRGGVSPLVMFRGRDGRGEEGPSSSSSSPSSRPESTPKDGVDEWGAYTLVEWDWIARRDSSDGDGVVLKTNVRTYRNRELVVFTQIWPDGYAANSSSSQTAALPFLASFPTFDVDSPPRGKNDDHDEDDDNHLSYVSWGGCFASDVMSGPWNDDPSLPRFDGQTSGSPILWHDGTGRSVVLSPLNNFFVSGQAITNGTAASAGLSRGPTSPLRLECGIRGTVSSLPPGFSHSTVLVGGYGINNTMTLWGDVLLSNGPNKKKRTDPYDDFVLSHLGYWTDNGAYYYHNHHGFNNEQEALLAVKSDLNARDIPVRYVQWDDWWMESRNDIPGIISWTPIPSVFPSGFTDWLGLPLSLYAPYYSKDNVWADTYGPWKVDSRKNASSIPLDPKFYRDLFANGTSIGMKMFEQDFFCTMNTDTSLTNNDVVSGQMWTKNMDDAAIEAGITLQWCMMNACHAMHSTLVTSMTNGRATGDNCREGPWNIASMGQNGLLFYSLGFFPSRDNVWTTSPDVVQDGCSYYPCVEINAALDNAVAVLGGGPYGPADAVGMINRDVVMRAARDDGVLLRAGWPLSSLDATFLRGRGRREALERERSGEQLRRRPRQPQREGTSNPTGDGIAADSPPLVWAAHDDHDGVGRWSYVVGVNLAEPFSLSPGDLSQRCVPEEAKEVAVAWPVGIGTGGKIKTTRFASSNPLVLPASPPTTDGSDGDVKKGGPGSTIWVAAPVLPNGMVLLGEVGKWATMSKRRFRDLSVSKAEGSDSNDGEKKKGKERGKESDKHEKCSPLETVLLSATVLGAPGERVAVSYLLPPGSDPDDVAAGVGDDEPESIVCDFSVVRGTEGCGVPDKHGDVDCRMILSCTAGGCKCTAAGVGMGEIPESIH